MHMAKEGSRLISVQQKGRCERHMRNPENVLNSLSSHSTDAEYVYDRLYRNMFNPRFFMQAYQSFKEGEVTPDEAHAIGVELAKEMWGKRFQIVVATHVNTKCVHNHIVITSVSFVDGRKFHDCRDMYKQLRDTSDRICLEHGLSVVKDPKGKRVGTYLYKMEHAGMPTRYNVARQAIDESVALSLKSSSLSFASAATVIALIRNASTGR